MICYCQLDMDFRKSRTVTRTPHKLFAEPVKLNLPTLESRRQYLSISFLHNIYHQRTSIKFNCHCKFNSISSTRSHHLSIIPPQSTINSRRYSFFVNTVFLWNSVPLTILNDPNPKSFRHSLYHYVCVN